MANQLLNLPVNVPWSLVGVSQDMMDVRFCDKRFPFEWRSSLALSRDPLHRLAQPHLTVHEAALFSHASGGRVTSAGVRLKMKRATS